MCCNVVIKRLSGSSSTWWYACFKSIFEKYFDPFTFALKSSKVGIICRSLKPEIHDQFSSVFN